MKKILALLIVFSSLLISSISWGEEFLADIYMVRTHGELDDNFTWFQLVGVTGVSDCKDYVIYGNADLTLMAIKKEESQMLSALLSAYAMGSQVHVVLNTDPVNYVSGLCRVTSLSLIK